MASVSMNIRMDSDIKSKAQHLFSEFGLDMTTAINMFLRQIVLNNGIPFEIKAPNPSKRLQDALDEGEKIMEEIRTGKRKPYDNINDLINALNSDD